MRFPTALFIATLLLVACMPENTRVKNAAYEEKLRRISLPEDWSDPAIPEWWRERDRLRAARHRALADEAAAERDVAAGKARPDLPVLHGRTIALDREVEAHFAATPFLFENAGHPKHFRHYIESCVGPMLEFGTRTFPKVNGKPVYGSLMLEFHVMPNGQIRGFKVVRGGGNAVLEEHARMVVARSSPCPPFGDDMAHVRVLGLVLPMSYVHGVSKENAP